MVRTSVEFLLNIGVSDAHPQENSIIRMYNGMCLIAASFSLIILLRSWKFGAPKIYFFVVSLCFILYSTVIGIHFLGRYRLARLFVCIGSAIWLCITYVSIGGFFSQSGAFMVILAITYTAFENEIKIRNSIFAFQIVFFLSAMLYVSIAGPLFPQYNFAYDEVFVFVGAVFWSSIMIKKFADDKTNLITELQQNNQELKQAQNEIERFSYIASHDLRSPLRTIINYTGLIEKYYEKGQYAKIPEKLEFVKTGALQMNALTQDILELTLLKNESQKKKTRLRLNDILSKAKFILKDELDEANATVNASDLPIITGTEFEFLILFQNIIQNGIKYNKNENPEITISHKIIEEELIITFKDNGIGIESKFHDLIFKFFKRLHTNDEYQGTGLGLGMCKQIVSNYKGRIELDSTLDEGSTFKVVLPYFDD